MAQTPVRSIPLVKKYMIVYRLELDSRKFPFISPLPEKKIMANIQSAAKRNRQCEKRTARNRVLSARIKTLRKEVLAAGSGSDAEFKKTFSQFASAVDKAAKKNYIHKKKAINLKSKTFKAAKATA